MRKKGIVGMKVEERSTKLDSNQLRSYQERGYHFPIRVFNDSEVADFRTHFDNYYAYNSERLNGLPASKHGSVYGHTHTFLRWVYRIVSHPKVLDAAESVLGPNLLVRDTGWFAKMPGDKKYVSWHQDATYWGLHPPHVTTAWVALSDSIPENGCMRVVPGSHKHPLLPHRDTYEPQNALSRGQEIAVEVDEAQAVDIVLRPGEISLHDVAIVHGSKANTSDTPRIGIAVRYMTPEVVQDGNVRQLGLLVRGEDKFGYSDLMQPPQKDDPANNAMQVESLDRLYRNNLSAETTRRNPN
jgi:non-heme Fe2+,alpha-ketoglutarate-dependent halogenase